LKTGIIGAWGRMVFGTEGHTTVGRLIGGYETPMVITHGETERRGATETEGMEANAMASTEGMEQVEATAKVEGMAAVGMAAVEGMAAVGVEVEGMGEGKISKELGNSLYWDVPRCLINGKHAPEIAAPSYLHGHSASGAVVTIYTRRELVCPMPRYEGAPPATESLILLFGKSDKAIQCLYSASKENPVVDEIAQKRRRSGTSLL
jgi:hypothetical protein